MNTATESSTNTSLREMLPLLVVSAVILVLSSLDQSTRGPSLTGLVLTHLNWFF
jgi:hypothetical protein